MSLAEILREIPKLTFEERQELIRCALDADSAALTPTEADILRERLADFKSNPEAGCELGQLKEHVLQYLPRK